MKKACLVWDTINERMGNGVLPKLGEDAMEVVFYNTNKQTEMHRLPLDQLSLYEYSNVEDVDGKRLAVNALVSIEGLPQSKLGVITKANTNKWYILLYELSNGQYTNENSLTIPLNKKNIIKHNIKNVGHLELFNNHMRQAK